jgi:hypothetical protein
MHKDTQRRLGSKSSKPPKAIKPAPPIVKRPVLKIPNKRNAARAALLAMPVGKHGCRSIKAQESLLDLCVDGNFDSKTMVEIGSYAGQSTFVFSFFCQCVYAIDPWCDSWKEAESVENIKLIQHTAPHYLEAPMSEIEKEFDRRTKSRSNIVKIKDFSDNIVSNFGNHSLDVIYIDSIHTYEVTKKNIELWVPKVKLGGIISGHDYYEPKWSGVVRAVNEAFGKPDKVYGDHSWIIDLSKRS